MSRPLLLVFAGRPGTGKTTLAQWICRLRGAVYLRVDVIEAAVSREGATVGALGYAIAHDLAVSNLALGHDVVIDAVNPVPEARAGWRVAAQRGQANLVVVETLVADHTEHRRRVEARVADIPDHVVPTWDQVEAAEWIPWDEQRDGARVRIDTTHRGTAQAHLLTAMDAT